MPSTPAEPSASPHAPDTARSEPLVPRWVSAPALLAFVLQCVAFHSLRRDDAFITFRYGQNLILGRGLVFNAGEHLMGSTSPGHVLLSAVMYAVVGHDALPSVMSCFGCLGWTAQALAFGVLLRSALGPWSAWTIAAAVALGAARSAEFVSMETNLVAALLLWALVMARERRWYATATLAALAALFRPDMYLPALMLGALCLRDLRARALKPMLLFVALAAPWLVFAQIYYGRVLPQSAVAKYNRTFWGQYARFAFDLVGRTVSSLSQRPAWYAAIWALVAIGAVVLVRRDRTLWVLPAFALLHYAAYLYMHPYMHEWHLYPAFLVFGVLALVAVISVLGFGFEHPNVRALGAASVLALMLGYAMHTVAFAREHETAFWFGSRDSAYREISRYLNKHALKSEWIATVEVGTLAYYTDMRMYDWGSLITVNPVQRPTTPRVDWTVVDSVFRPTLGGGMIAMRRFDHGKFVVDVNNFPVMEEAARRLMQTHVVANPAALRDELRPEFERSVAAVSREIEQTGKPVHEFLASAHSH